MVRWLRVSMIAVVQVAFVTMVVLDQHEPGGLTTSDRRVVVPVTVLVGSAYGLGAMRRPWTFLAPLAAIWILAPAVDHPNQDVISVSAAACLVAWLLGAPAGWVVRRMRRYRTGRKTAVTLPGDPGSR